MGTGFLRKTSSAVEMCTHFESLRLLYVSMQMNTFGCLDLPKAARRAACGLEGEPRLSADDKGSTHLACVDFLKVSNDQCDSLLQVSWWKMLAT